MKKINVLSLFDGMSCGQIALERAGIEVNQYFASEIDKNAIKVTQQNYPNTIQLGDVCKLQPSSFDDIDLLMGGSPCQSFSRSGDGSGFDGKSKLFWEYIRLLKEKKPKYFLLENVVMRKDWEDVISNELGVSPIMIDSKLVSAQKRQRLYWTNIPDIKQPDDRGVLINQIIDSGNKDYYDFDSNFMWFENGEWRVVNATKKGYLTVNNFDVVNLDFPKSKTRRGRVSQLKSNTLNTGCNQAVFIDGKLIKLNAIECRRLQTIHDSYDMSMIPDREIKKICGNGWTIEVIVHILKNLNNHL